MEAEQRDEISELFNAMIQWHFSIEEMNEQTNICTYRNRSQQPLFLESGIDGHTEAQ